jgi:hypothetical protein
VVVEKCVDAAGALLACRRVGEAADESDSAAAVAVEMLRGRVPAVAVLRAHIVDIQPVQTPGE